MKGETNDTERNAVNDTALAKSENRPLSKRGMLAMQGATQDDLQIDGAHPKDGHEFERWVNTKYFGNQGRRLNVNVFDNYEHLDRSSDSGFGLEHERRTDIYLDNTGEIWELKSGYESGSITKGQLEDYQSMLNAGYVYETDENNKKVPRAVNNVYYLFGSKEGARNNASKFVDRDIFLCYVDDNNDIQQLTPE